VTHDQIEAMTLGQRIVVLDRGQIQQIDTPMRLYQHPANRFVAGFLGSPSMNFVQGRLQPDGPRLELGSESLSLQDVPGIEAVLSSHAQREVVLGVRPEHVLLASRGAGVGPSLSARLEAIEPIGSELHLVLSHPRGELIARVAPGPLPQAGASLPLRFAADHLHFFAADEAGERIGPTG
jgi:multiple sugar transport system ATP-binding protein